MNVCLRSLVALVLMPVCALVSACSQEEVADGPPPVRPAKVLVVSESDNVQSLRLPIVVEAIDTTVLAFQVGGQLKELDVTEGQEVKAGDRIAQLDQRDFSSTVTSAKATFDNAVLSFRRAEELIKNGNIAQSVYDQRKAGVDVARADLERARKALEDSTITAPFDGIVAKVEVEAFESIAPQQPIATLQSDGQLDAVAQVPASLVASRGRIEPISLKVSLDVRPDLVMEAELREASQTSDPGTQTFTARFAFTPPEELEALPGMTGFLEGRFRLRGEENGVGVMVPVTAIVGESGDTFVFVFEPGTKTVSKRQVDVARGEVGQAVRITSGLEPGEQVVISGASYLVDGMKIVPLVQDGGKP